MVYRSIFILAACLGLPSTGFSVVNLKDVRLDTPSTIVLSFDSDVSESQFKVDAFESTLQITLRDTSVYPAIVRRGDSDSQTISKVFAYQYTPNVVRVRISTEGKAEEIKTNTRVTAVGRQLKVQIAKNSAVPAPERKSSAEVLKQIAELEEKDTDLKLNTEERPSPFKGLWITLVMVSGLVILLWVFKSFKGRRGRGGSLGARPGFGRFIQGLGLNADTGAGKWIEILSQTHLGPKKSLAVVRVRDRTLLVGITEDQINLISEFDEDSEVDSSVEERSFEETLKPRVEGPSSPKSSEWKNLVRERVQRL